MRNTSLVAAVVLAAACAETTVPSGPKPVATVAVTAADTLMRSFGDTLALQAVARDESGTEIVGKTFSWSSAQPEVATVTGDGQAVAVGMGLATLTASVDGKSASTTIRVLQSLDSIAVPAAVTLASINETKLVIATPLDARNNPIVHLSATWTSSAPGIATVHVSTGQVKAMANGQATLTATIDGMTALVPVTVAQVASQLAFVAQPITTQAGVSMPAVTIAVRDALGTTVAGATNAVSIALGPHVANGVLSGTSQVNAVNGVATFTGLSVDVAAAGYTLSAAATGTTFATSNAFEIMNVAARIDSVKLTTTNVKRGASTPYQIWVTNGAGRNLTGAGTQAYLVVGPNQHGAGGSQAIGCSPTGGVIPHGSCRMDRGLSLQSSVPLGPAIARIVFFEGTTQHATLDVPVTVVP